MVINPKTTKVNNRWYLKEQEITDLSTWIRANHATVRVPNSVFAQGRHVGNLCHVRNKLMYIPAITWDEWQKINAKHPVDGEFGKSIGI